MKKINYSIYNKTNSIEPLSPNPTVPLPSGREEIMASFDYKLDSVITCESKSLRAFLRLTPLPFNRLFDPGGKWKQMSDVQGSKRTDSKQLHKTKIFMVCTKQREKQVLSSFAKKNNNKQIIIIMISNVKRQDSRMI